MADRQERKINWAALAEQMGMTEKEVRDTFEANWQQKPPTVEQTEELLGMRRRKIPLGRKKSAKK